MAGVDEHEEEVSGGADEPLDRRDTDPSSGTGRKRSAKSADRDPIGKTFGGKYRIDKLIAKGGMGRVFKATQFPLERPVAIKILNREFQESDPQFVKRFFLEASIAAQLSHPHTITVFDYGESDTGDLYIAMEFLKGRPLSRVLRNDGPLGAAETIRLAIQICRALRAAHEKGIIHRDLKPGNIFILEDQAEDGGCYAKVLDFGLVKLFTPEGDKKGNALGPNLLGEGEGELTRTGTLLGSPKYMSPEQIQGLPLDPRTDIYSLGIIMYQMISGKAPFTGATGVDVIYKHVNFPVPPISSQNPDADCPRELEEIIKKCLEKRRDDRFPSMDALLERLKDVQRSISGMGPVNESSDISSGARRRMLEKPLTREVSFREPMGEEPTPLGSLTMGVGERTGSADKPNRVPLLFALVGFTVAVWTMVYVLAWSPAAQTTTPATQELEPKTVAPAAVELPKVVPPAIETPPPPPVEEEVEAIETIEEESQPTKKKRIIKKKKRAREKEREESAEEDEEVPVPPNYRENPY